MKQTLLFFCALFFVWLTTIGRYKPVSLDLVQPSAMRVEVKGEVQKPGVYTVKWKANVKEILEVAGGKTAEADLSGISLVRICKPNDVIVIPEKEKIEIKKVSINSGTREQLMSLPRIGPSMAEKIIEYRKEHTFQTLEDLMEVKGIGPKMFEKLKEFICL